MRDLVEGESIGGARDLHKGLGEVGDEAQG